MIDIRWKILSILFLILVKSSESLDIPKCCPEDEGLVFNGSYYLCSSENFFKTAPLKLGFSKDDQFIEKFPENCEEIIAIPYEPALKLPFNYCLDKMMNESDGKIVVLHCEEQASSWKHSNLTLRSVNKCCEIDEIFDPKYFRCLKSSNSTSLFINFVSGENVLLNINSGLPECVNPKVMMTYSSDDFKLLINSEDDIELVGDGKKINLKANEFCIDDTNEESLVVRSCRPGCEYGICVNKCCPEGQTFSLSSCSGFPQCVENKEFGFRPKYYNVSYQPIIEVEPPGDKAFFNTYTIYT